MAHLHRLPKSVRGLRIIDETGAPLPLQLPAALTSLKFFLGFGLPLADYGELPETLQSITFPAWKGAQGLDRIQWPAALTELC